MHLGVDSDVQLLQLRLEESCPCRRVGWQNHIQHLRRNSPEGSIVGISL